MRNSKVLAKIRAGKPARLAHMGYFNPPFIAYAAQANYDGIWLDLEHHVMDGREIQSLLAFFHRYDIDCMLRPPTREKGQLYRYLEDGVTGLLMPHVSNAQTARELVQKVKFPPVGDRGIEGLGFETNFGLDTGDTPDSLTEHANRETFLFVQIETPEGLANVEAIAAVPGIDGLFIGPNDLRIRIAHQPPQKRVSYEDTLTRVAAACKTHHKAWGTFTMTTDEVLTEVKLGAQIISFGADFLLLKNGLAQSGRDLDEALDG
jgi:4-hydroxy-2-oxoheptanedioate aldolase